MTRIIPLLLTATLILCFSTSNAQVVFDPVNMDPSLQVADARGIVLADYDNDGDDDIFISGRPSRLIRNNGDWTFEDVTAIAGLGGHDSYTALWIDLNNDGLVDLVSSSWQQSAVFMNRGQGRLEEVSSFDINRRQALLGGDLNGDGWLDVFSANLNAPHELLINAGGGLLIDEGQPRGVATTHVGMGGVLVDMDMDGDLDVYLVYDSYDTSELFENDGSGNFINVAENYGLNTESQAMGIDEDDLNGDGRPDFYITNLFENYLLMSQPDGTYAETGAVSGTDDYGMGWGTRVFDANNDGSGDIYVHNSYNFSFYPNKLYINRGDNTFDDAAAGTPLENLQSGYGMATSDLDNDGLQDILLVNTDEEGSFRIFRNRTVEPGKWLQIDLVGSAVNAFGVGSRIEVYSGDLRLTRQVRAGAGWLSQHGFRQHFGLGHHEMIDSVIVYWPDGSEDRYFDLAADRRYILSQGSSATLYDAEVYSAALSASVLPDEPQVELPELPDESLSIARQWNEALLLAIRNDYARPTVHARNLFHLSIAMYDAWAILNGNNTYLIGKAIHGFESDFEGFRLTSDLESAQREAISYAAYRLLEYRFSSSPGRGITGVYIRSLMERAGYDRNFRSTNYSGGSPAALGNYIAQQMIQYGQQDGSNEADNYENLYYTPVNASLFPFEPGNPDISDPNRWQPLELINFIDQSGNADGSIPPFLGPEWGNVFPFAMDDTDAIVRERDGGSYRIYHDPGHPPYISETEGLDDRYKWTHTMVSVWGSHLDPEDGIMIDISPGAMGNNTSYPSDPSQYAGFYDYFEGGDGSEGYSVNPVTGEAYNPNIVPRGDFARVLAEFWADGPDSETPPGHWFTLLNYVSDHPMFEGRWMGEGPVMDELEWYVKAYLVMGGGMHDAAISAWSIKGYYDYIRPISAIRYMAERGQSSDPDLPSFDPHGLPLIPGFVELIEAGDPLAGPDNEYAGEVRVYTWRGHAFIENPETDKAGVGWIRAKEWFSYQRPTFVTPPFAGYISGHSTFSSAAAEVLSLITGSEFFPGGVGEFIARRNEFLVFEEGPSMDIVLQWARYRDAADQSSMSRIWGGIHPPADDIPGRLIGIEVGTDAVAEGNRIFNGETITSTEIIIRGTLSVYPNPARSNGVINIQPADGFMEIRLLDLSGRQIWKEARKDGTPSVRLPVLAEGLYLLEISNRNGRDAVRLLVR